MKFTSKDRNRLRAALRRDTVLDAEAKTSVFLAIARLPVDAELPDDLSNVVDDGQTDGEIVAVAYDYYFG
jgi:hypothetical protein